MGSAATALTRRRLGGAVALFVLAFLSGGALLHHLSRAAQLPLPDSLQPRTEAGLRPRYLDRYGQPLSATLDNPLNLHDQLPLHEIPSLLQRAFIVSEDRRFYHHQGADWLARGHALMQNLMALRQVRGASTISEQVVRILHPRPRTLWSRWLEGLDARELERRFTKNDILEFYLNQVPYDRRRRGVQQAAQLYFGRSLSTLNPTEILTLAVLVRAPSRLSRPENHDHLQQAVRRLAGQLSLCRESDQPQCRELAITLPPPTALSLPVAADHFLRHLAKVSSLSAASLPSLVHTTLDATLQGAAQKNLAEQLVNLKALQVHNGAVLVIDHLSDEILAWVSVGDDKALSSTSWLDAVTAPRQPGSTLKPFLYALALERGWTAATQIDDSPLSGQVGDGTHPFRNYSRHHYGPLPLRQALGNSLNLPAIRTVRHTGIDPFLERLRAAGMDSLDRNAAHYGEGLALGNGEVTLLELVRAYAVLARSGVFRPLGPTFDGQNPDRPGQRVFSAEAASLIADILADPRARRLEFGDGSILRFPGETAVKTGTSNDHRDAWALGFDSHYTVGVWMGNLDGRSTLGLSGASGPALVLRALFSELQRRGKTKPLWRSPRLERHAICMASGVRAAQGCASIDELFLPGTAPNSACPAGDHQGPALVITSRAPPPPLRLVQPTPGLLLALDPHIPDELEAYALKLGDVEQLSTAKVEWLINGQVVGTTSGGEGRFLWPLRRGAHLAQARLHRGGGVEESPAVDFTVK
jgi:penicillin-binding protein 1C